MKKDYLKYLFILICACSAFVFIDKVSALSNSSRVVMSITGTQDYTIYAGSDIYQSAKPLGVIGLFGTSFMSGSFVATSYGVQYSSFLRWTVPVEVVQGYDKVSFTLGSKWGYFNNASFTTGLGWSACTALSLPPVSNDDSGGYTSFVCDVDQTSVPETGTVTLYMIAYLTRLLDARNSQGNIGYSIYYQNDVIFYKSQDSVVESEIKNNTDAINKQTQSFDDFKNTDIDDSQKELPDDTSLKDYDKIEGELMDQVGKADMDVIDIGIDTSSSNWVWNTTTKLIKSHPAVFGMFISILSIGIIKLALGR